MTACTKAWSINSIGVRKEMTWKTLLTNQMYINAYVRPADVAVFAIADCSVALTVVTATVVPARTVSTGCMNKVGYR